MLLKNKLILLFFPLALSVCFAQQQVSDTASINKLVKYSVSPNFIDFKTNYFEWQNPSSVGGIYDKLKKGDNTTILHIGDSHLQFDLGAGTTRKRLQQVFGSRGRGLVFPYAAAGTHSTYDYSSASYGNWRSNRNVSKNIAYQLGVSGVTINTRDSLAGFSISFYNSDLRESDINLAVVFFKNTDSSFNIKYRLNKNDDWIFVNVHNSTNKNCVRIPLAASKFDRYFELRCVKSASAQKEFECSGVSFESTEKKGVLYHSVGINGARISSFLRQELNDEQLKTLNPDIIIFDLAANDLAFGPFDSIGLSKSLLRSLNVIRNSLPNASILIANIQDISVKERSVINALYYSVFLRKFSKTNQIAFYDYYDIAGGKGSINKWLKAGLCASDKCHLSKSGYILKGELFANALLNSFGNYLMHPNDSLLLIRKPIVIEIKIKDSLNTSILVSKEIPVKKDVIAKERVPVKPVPAVVKPVPAVVKPVPVVVKPKKPEPKYYVVKKGDNLSRIANKYKVSVKALQLKNKLKTDFLQIGQKLLIP